MNEWQKLEARYASKKLYAKRKVLFNKQDKDDFVNYLIDSGAEIILEPKQSEAFRFRLNGELGIVYTKGSGNLLAHDIGYKYDCLNNKEQVQDAKSCRWSSKYYTSEFNYGW